MERVMYNTILGASPPGRQNFYYADYNSMATGLQASTLGMLLGTLPQVSADYRINVYFRGPRQST